VNEPPLILLGSPRAQGAGDAIGGLLAEGLAQAGIVPRTVAVRDHAILPCQGCLACASPPHACPLGERPDDDAEGLFSLLLQAPLILLVAPVYFYALPAHFKALVDRAQRFWAAGGGNRPPKRPALVTLTAGSANGEHIFEGTLLSLKYFLLQIGVEIREVRRLRGVQGPGSILGDAGACDDLRSWGRAWGERCAPALA
jgi:multimeric flavodoxin WrbA